MQSTLLSYAIMFKLGHIMNDGVVTLKCVEKSVFLLKKV